MAVSMYNDKRKEMRRTIMVLCICFFCVIVSQILLASVLAGDTDEQKITVTNRADQQGFIGSFELKPFSLAIVDELYEIDHIVEIIPAVVQSYGTHVGDRPFGNFTGEPPNWNGSFNEIPPDWNGSRPERNVDDRMQNMFDYIVEGVPLGLLGSFTYYTLPFDIVGGRQLVENDSFVVFIGEGAQDYFNVSVGDDITIEGNNFTVIGVFSDVNYSKYVFMNITDARILSNLVDTEVNTLYVYVDDLVFLDTISNEIQDDYSYLMTKYLGDNTQIGPPDNIPYFTDEGSKGISTPGFEFTLVFGVISFFITFKIMFKRRL
jgi:hypothetical protein